MRAAAWIMVLCGVVLAATQLWEAMYEDGGKLFFWILSGMFLVSGAAQLIRSRRTDS
ncbi:MAG: hypothetical protein KJ060_10850 [Candidatus Hydrogenedentes bacterium]|nr:hypothetical protein [Candidatus Hydrogenedentota bacterium]